MRTLPLCLVLSLSVACSKTKKVETPTSPVGNQERPAKGPARAASGSATVTTTGEGSDGAPATGAIYFEFDSVTLSATARGALDRLAAWLEPRTNRVTIEGHADERGTTEYNVALGQRRAQVIAEYLQRLGIDGKRLDTISYGEEHPAVSGNDESSWAQNRRGEVRPRD